MSIELGPPCSVHKWKGHQLAYETRSGKQFCICGLPYWPPDGDRDGRTFQPQDRSRLNRQAQAVWDAMQDHRWHTLAEISQATGAPEASVSARLRDFRKPRFGGHTVLHRRVGTVWEYRIP